MTEEFIETGYGIYPKETDWKALAMKLRGALWTIGAYNHKCAQDLLDRDGSYSGFDEPASVMTARQAIADFDREVPLLSSTGSGIFGSYSSRSRIKD